jgi:hypothetical protein
VTRAGRLLACVRSHPFPSLILLWPQPIFF